MDREEGHRKSVLQEIWSSDFKLVEKNDNKKSTRVMYKNKNCSLSLFAGDVY